MPTILTRSRIAKRYCKIDLAFFLSGLCHVVGHLSGGLQTRYYDVMWFFCVQTMGIVVEDAAQYLFILVGGLNVYGYSSFTSCIPLFGYIWTICWLTWTTPVYLLSIIRDADL